MYVCSIDLCSFFSFGGRLTKKKKTWNGQIEHTLSTWKQIRMRH